jgi:hypothetical protein
VSMDAAARLPQNQGELEELFKKPETQLELARWLHFDDPVAQLKLFRQSMGMDEAV